jgi:hypothetical protein
VPARRIQYKDLPPMGFRRMAWRLDPGPSIEAVRRAFARGGGDEVGRFLRVAQDTRDPW